MILATHGTNYKGVRFQINHHRFIFLKKQFWVSSPISYARENLKIQKEKFGMIKIRFNKEVVCVTFFHNIVKTGTFQNLYNAI